MKITFLGDVMVDYNHLPLYKKNNEYNFDESFNYVKSYLKKSDYVIANLETPIAGPDLGFTDQNYSFNTPVELAESLKKVGVNLVTTANNHCLDRGITGLLNTLDNLHYLNFDVVGTHTSIEPSFLVKEIGGNKIGFLAFTYGTNAFFNKNYLRKDERHMVDLLQEQELINPITRYIYMGSSLFCKVVRKFMRLFHIGQVFTPIHERTEKNKKQMQKLSATIEECKKKSDFVVLCAHIGGQYNSLPTEYTKWLCDEALKMGVDAVIANHEHVIHPINLKNKFIIYSLGNFLSSNGVDTEPFDKMSEYSVGVNFYFKDNTFELPQISLVLFKCSKLENGKIATYLLYDLINNSKGEDKKKLLNEYNALLNKILGTSLKDYPLKEEWFLEGEYGF